MQRWSTFFLALLASLTLFACTQNDARLYTPKDARWLLIQAVNLQLPRDVRLTLSFNAKEAGGYAGCNSFGSRNYVAKNGTFRFGEAMITSRACGMLKLESAYTKMLWKIDGYRFDKKELVLTTAGREVLRYEFVGPTPNAKLENTSWQLQTWLIPSSKGAPVVAMHSQHTTQFRVQLSSGKITGKTPCGTFSGTYTQKGTALTLQAIQQASAKCPTDAQEDNKRFFAMLPKIRSFRIQGNNLRLSIDASQGLDFQKK
ncbi:MAG: META domain-containing protein [Myxococcales bacterium]|nr:META domain-containing protein [Myxococcales bacterium]